MPLMISDYELNPQLLVSSGDGYLSITGQCGRMAR